MLEVGKKGVGKSALEMTDEGFGFGLSFETDHERLLQAFADSESMGLGEVSFRLGPA